MALRLLGRPADYLDTYVARVEGITAEQADQALAEILRPASQTVVVVGSPALEEKLAGLPGIATLKVIPSSHDGPVEG